MNPGNADLIRFIRSEIEKHGPQSFDWFMRQALYHPDHGYYSSGRCVIGRKGDYFTSVSVGPLFGRLLGAQFSEIWERLGKVKDFVIVEHGAHDGQFARDVLEFAQKSLPEFFDSLCYRIVEPFSILQQRQRQTLNAFRDKVDWHSSLQPFIGVHFSNELLDAMPVRLIRRGMEKLVGLEGGKFVFVEQPIGNTTFNEATLEIIEQIAENLQRGYAIAIDYGFLDEEFESNVQVRNRHRNLDSPFEKIGAADITMPVDWSSIVHRAETNGLRVAGFTDQHHFLTGIISTWPNLIEHRLSNLTALSSQVQDAAADRKTKRALHTLLHPEMLGRAFQVLALEKKTNPGARQLAGFKFARESRQTAGI